VSRSPYQRTRDPTRKIARASQTLGQEVHSSRTSLRVSPPCRWLATNASPQFVGSSHTAIPHAHTKPPSSSRGGIKSRTEQLSLEFFFPTTASLTMSGQDQTTANKPTEPRLCKMGCGFFVSIWNGGFNCFRLTWLDDTATPS
jgi:hypothetical protein